MRPSTKMRQWERMQTAHESERQRIAYLKGPVPQNDPAIMKPTKVRVLKPTFCIKGKPVQVDTIITLPYCDAVSLQALHKIEIIRET